MWREKVSGPKKAGQKLSQKWGRLPENWRA